MNSLIIEDDLTTRLVLTEMLCKFGKCDAVSSGEEGLAAISYSFQNTTHYDLICLDIGMPNMDGHETLKEIRSIEHQNERVLGNGSKVIMITGYDNKENIMEALRSNCDAYLVKPLEYDKLHKQLVALHLI